MTRPQRRPSAAMAAAMSGAVDLSALKARAQTPPPSAEDQSGAGFVVDATEANFEETVIKRSAEVPVVVILWSRRSPASAQFGDLLADLAAADGGRWQLARIEAEANMGLAKLFQAQAVPLTIAIAAGRPMGDFEGALPADEARAWIDSVLEATAGQLGGPAAQQDSENNPEPPGDPRFDAAEEAVADGDYAAAEQRYQAILDSEPANSDALTALRQVRFLARLEHCAPDAISRADTDPTSVELACAAADVELSQQRAEQAFDRLIATFKLVAGDERTQIRTRLIELFELFEPNDPRVTSARRKLAAALY